MIASAVLDRLIHHAHLVPIIGESYRMKNLKAPKGKGGGRHFLNYEEGLAGRTAAK